MSQVNEIAMLILKGSIKKSLGLSEEEFCSLPPEEIVNRLKLYYENSERNKGGNGTAAKREESGDVSNSDVCNQD